MMMVHHNIVQQNKPQAQWSRRQHKRRIRRNTSTTTRSVKRLVGFVTVVVTSLSTVSSFVTTISSHYHNCYRTTIKQQQTIYSISTGTWRLNSSINTEALPPQQPPTSDVEDDISLLNSVDLVQLKKLCDQCSVSYDDLVNESNTTMFSSNDITSSSTDIKLELLQRLRNHANTQAEIERQRLLARKVKVEISNNMNDEVSTAFEESAYNTKERYEIVQTNNDDPEYDPSDEGYFYFDLPTMSDDLKRAQLQSISVQQQQNIGTASKASTILTSDQVTSPPPPIEPNANGERVVKIYSTTQLNDLTSIAASQPGQTAILSSLDSTQRRTDGKKSDPQPWDFVEQQQYTSNNNNHPYIEQAKEQLIELVATLLAMSDVPGFANSDGSLDNDDEENAVDSNAEFIPYHAKTKTQTPSARVEGGASNDGKSHVKSVGFNPVNVPVDLLTSSSKAIRACRGEVLDEVLRQYEIRGIGYDGKAGDNQLGGGGHYHEVIKVRAFLEGYRRAEVRRLARETSSMLLNKLMIEGIDALDLTLNAMIRSNDDTEEYGGTQLNDSLLDFLNDVIRQKEKEVETRYGDRSVTDGKDQNKKKTDQLSTQDTLDPDGDDDLDQYWNITEVDGQRMETFDPNNENVKNIMQAKLDNLQHQNSNRNSVDIPETAPEQVLLLLKLLRERIKAEAAFAHDEKGRNLRLLAYCLHADTDDECETYILKQLGNSLDRLDSFVELVTSSIEYGESTSYELQPAKNIKTKLDVQQLRHVLNLAMELRTRQSMKASGVQP